MKLISKITIFTPTYNRAYCLHQVYESLVAQTNQNFCWLVIDDGSTDNTKELVHSWIKEHKIQIQYIYQENQGMHGAHNTAYENITTELNTCIDSDDYMPNNAIEIILNFWRQFGSNQVAGIVGLDATKEGKVIGTKIPTNLKQSTLYDLYQNFGVMGDKKLVYRTEVVKKYPPYPLFKGENFVPLGYKYLLIDQDYNLLTLNEVLCIVEYRPDGSSMNMLSQYKRNPKGWAFSRISRMEHAKNRKDLFKNAIHYVSSSLMIKDIFFLKKSTKKMTIICAIPLGIALYLYIQFRTFNYKIN
jgi:glycosyltransferase involved in cell wall biosynthesis